MAKFFFAKLSFNLFHEKMRNFSKIGNSKFRKKCKNVEKKIMRKFLMQKLSKLSYGNKEFFLKI